ncbi:MAG: hypothetical protein AAFQ27_09415 [Pseudomonadota bacterium]
MSAYIDNLEKMMAIWNTTDADEIERLAAEALEHNVHFADPNHNILGRNAFIEMVHLVQKQIPGAVYARNSEIDIQNNFCRYHWKIDRDGRRIMNGFDVTEVSDGGKILKVIGFFGALERED